MLQPGGYGLSGQPLPVEATEACQSDVDSLFPGLEEVVRVPVIGERLAGVPEHVRDLGEVDNVPEEEAEQGVEDGALCVEADTEAVLGEVGETELLHAAVGDHALMLSLGDLPHALPGPAAGARGVIAKDKPIRREYQQC